MPELLPLDAAAAAVGKSEITLRRLVKAGKVPAEREQTITGFIYRVDPEAVKAYYAEREQEVEAAVPILAPVTTTAEPSRIAVSTKNFGNEDYWRKRAERYEQKYDESIRAHLKTKEELGLWKGKFELAQAPQAAENIKPLQPQTVRLAKKSKPAQTPTATADTDTVLSKAAPVILGLLVSLAIVGGIVATQLH